MNLQAQLRSPYSRDAWLGLLRTLFKNSAELFATPIPISDPAFRDVFARVLHLGDLKTADGKTAALLDIEVAPEVNLPRNRAGIRHLAARLVDGTTRQGILAAFHGEASTDWRFSFIAREKSLDLATGETQCRETPARRFTYLLGPAETCRTAAERFATLSDQTSSNLCTFANLEAAFSVEKLSDAFFTEYISHYETFAQHAARFAGAKDWTADTEPARHARHFAKRLLARLVFLHFLQKKRWIGCSPASAPHWADGDTDFLNNLFQSCTAPNRFHTACLIPLFYETLNARRKGDLFKTPAGCPGKAVRIPYLNGGLFEENPAEKTFRAFDFPEKLFQELFAFFHRFNFTIDESDPLDIEIGVDPEMLGRIFEALLEDNKEKGAYYTPKAIVAYMCQEALIHYLTQGSSSFQLESQGSGSASFQLVSQENKQDACDTVFFNPHAEVAIARRNLPHWCQHGVMYFVTFRLSDSLPKEKVDQLLQEREAWHKHHREPYSDAERREYAELFSERVEEWLDAGSGSCCLAQLGPAEQVAQALRHFHGDRYVLDEWVVMPNHVHALVTPLGKHALSDILHAWKSYTANQINKLRGTTGQFWQHESYDHIVRSEKQLHRFRRYIRENPAKAGITVAQASKVGQASCLPASAGVQASCLPVSQAGSLSYSASLRPVIERLIRQKEPIVAPPAICRHLDALLRDIKICDPAIGSGAFPMGMLQEIVRARLALNPRLDPAELKAHTIQNSIYGVDLDAGAVDIARLRFWLSLVVDEREPRPLPNLDYKIMQGNSLLESFEGVNLSRIHTPETVSVKLVAAVKTTEFGFITDVDPNARFEEQMLTLNKSTVESLDALLKAYFSESDPDRKQTLRHEIDSQVRAHIADNFRIDMVNVRAAIQFTEEKIADKKRLHQPLKSEERTLDSLNARLAELERARKQLDRLDEFSDRPYFLWHLFFHDVFAAGGFDVVIGNPPYVRQETIKDLKPALKAEGYACFDGVADLLVYFYERGVTLLRPGGTIAFITSNKFYRAGYGEKLREFLARELTLHRLIDFGDAPVFAAIAYASILTGERTAPAHDTSARAYTWEKEMDFDHIAQVVAARGQSIRQSELKPDGWRLESPAVLRLLEKLRAAGKPLGKYVEGRFYYGIKTGLNEAFVVDRITRDRLIAEDKSSAKIIKPFLRGRDVKRWRTDFAEQYLIKIESSEN